MVGRPWPHAFGPPGAGYAHINLAYAPRAINEAVSRLADRTPNPPVREAGKSGVVMGDLRAPRLLYPASHPGQ